jgi:hypothetical protein
MCKTILALGKQSPVLSAIVSELLSAGKNVSIVKYPASRSVTQQSLVSVVMADSVKNLVLDNHFEAIFINLYEEPSPDEMKLIREVLANIANRKDIRIAVLTSVGKSWTGLLNTYRKYDMAFTVFVSSFIFEDLLLLSFKTIIHLSRELISGSYGVSARDIGRQIVRAIGRKNQYSGKTYFVYGPEKIDLKEASDKARQLLVTEKPSLQVKNLCRALAKIRRVAFFMPNSAKPSGADKTWNELGKPQISFDGFLKMIA